MRILSGDGSAAGNNIDHDYVTGTGVGGIGPTHGNPGMAIIRPQTIATLQQHVSSSHTEGNDCNNTKRRCSLVIKESRSMTKSELYCSPFFALSSFHFPF